MKTYLERDGLAHIVLNELELAQIVVSVNTSECDRGDCPDLWPQGMAQLALLLDRMLHKPPSEPHMPGRGSRESPDMPA